MSSKENLINPDFKTSVYFDGEIMTVEKLLSCIKKEVQFVRDIHRIGYATSDKFPFITRANFDYKKRSCLNEEKTPMEKEETRANRIAVQEYLSKDMGRPVDLQFMYKDDHECVLYDKNKIATEKLIKKLENYFV
ncbi:Uncharacterised protein [uncultured Eubacterium sp.]|nr:Uncharacterised protein [uncultured Eubacterium sp.]